MHTVCAWSWVVVVPTCCTNHPKCTSLPSHNAPFLTEMCTHMCAHFCYKWCIMRYMSDALWDLWDWLPTTGDVSAIKLGQSYPDWASTGDATFNYTCICKCRKWYYNYSKTKLSTTVCILYWMYGIPPKGPWWVLILWCKGINQSLTHWWS